MKLSVSRVAGSNSSTKSDWASTSGVRSGGTTSATSSIGSGWRRVPITRMPSTAAMRATSCPIAPRPRMPRVISVSGCAMVGTQRRCF